MYIGGTDLHGYHHLLREILDNSIDEVINGHASTIHVDLDEDYRGVAIEDDGRGIPIAKMAKYKKPAVEVILTTLHSGGKFDGDSYEVSGGLHGVGSSVVNALSEEMTVWISREGGEWTQSYARGKATTKLTKVGRTKEPALGSIFGRTPPSSTCLPASIRSGLKNYSTRKPTCIPTSRSSTSTLTPTKKLRTITRAAFESISPASSTRRTRSSFTRSCSISTKRSTRARS